MTAIRERTNPPGGITSLTPEQYAELKNLCAQDAGFWGTELSPYDEYVAKFRDEVKTYYYWGQKSLCCYCSKPLQHHKRAYDAEHIIDKSTYPQHMFEANNLAASCISCNGRKSNKPVLKTGVDAAASVPINQDDYLIVHPHLDEWSEHLGYDEIGRIVALPGKSKGIETIRICGIGFLNAIALANNFSPELRKDAHKYLIAVLGAKSSKKIEKHITLLEQMADKLPSAKAALDRFRAELP